MSDDITGDLDLLGDWLDAKGYTEEAGLCTRAMDEINKLRAALHNIEEYIAGRIHMHNQIAGFAGSSLSGKKQRVRASEAADILGNMRAAAAALKETGDE